METEGDVLRWPFSTVLEQKIRALHGDKASNFDGKYIVAIKLLFLTNVMSHVGSHVTSHVTIM